MDKIDFPESEIQLSEIEDKSKIKLKGIVSSSEDKSPAVANNSAISRSKKISKYFIPELTIRFYQEYRLSNYDWDYKNYIDRWHKLIRYHWRNHPPNDYLEGSIPEGGEVFVLDMGQPIKIAELAKRMIELSGLTVKNKYNFDGDIEIKITGLRPGEKLYEELLIGDNPENTIHPKIKKAKDPYIEWDKLSPIIEELSDFILNNKEKKIVGLLEASVDGFNPSKKMVDVLLDEKLKESKREKK